MTTPVQNEKLAFFSAEMDAFLFDQEIPVLGYAVSVFQNDRIVFERAGGFRRYADGIPEACLPMEVSSRCRIASVSKLFTCIAIMQQVEQGRMELDGDAGDYLGFPLRNPHFPNVVITPRLLMAHTSSLRDGAAYSIPQAVPIRACFFPGECHWENGGHFARPDARHNMAPGGFYLYSNLNYGVLGTMVERLSGERFDRYMRLHVLEPMGIGASFNPGDFSPDELHNLAAIYKRCSGGVWAANQPWTAQTDALREMPQSPDRIWISNPDLGVPDREEDVSNYRPGTNGTLFSPQGGLRISVHELALFGQMLLNGGRLKHGGQVVSPDSIKALFTPVWSYDPRLDNRDPTDSAWAYGAGFNIISPALGGDHMAAGRDDITLYGHTGSAYGLLSACYVDPVRSLGFAYAFNGIGADPERHPGRYCSRSIWHERTMSAICKAFF